MALPAVFADGPRFSGNSLMLGSALFLAGSTILVATIAISAVRKITSKVDLSLTSINDRNESIAVVTQLDSQKLDLTFVDSSSLSKSINAFKKTLTDPLRSFIGRLSASPSGRAFGIATTALLLFAALPPPVKTALLIASKYAVLNFTVFLKPGLIVCGATFQSLAAVTMSVASTILIPILSIAFVAVAGFLIMVYAIRALYNKFIAGMNNMKEAALNFTKSMKNSVLEWGDTLLSQIPGYSFASSFFKSKEKPVEIVQTPEERRAAIAKENEERRAEYDRDNQEFVARAKKEYEEELLKRKIWLQTPCVSIEKSPLLVVTEETPTERREGFICRQGSPLVSKPNKEKK